MAEKIVLETEIKTGNSASSVKSVKQELKSLQAELANLEIGSDAFTNAAQKAAGLRDKIDDAAAGVKAFNPEAKFAAFAGVLGGVASGFAAAQGAMALFGSENKDIEQAILKTQGAMALATGISGLGGMYDAVGLLASKIKTQLVAAFGTMKSAMLSTGIGALIILIGVAISKISDYNQAIEDETNAQEKLNEELKKTQDLMEAQVTGTEKVKNAKKGGLDDLKREKELLEAKGATEKEIFEKSQEIANKELANLRTRRESGLEATKEIADKENEIKAQQLAYDKFVEDEKDKNAKDAADKRKADKEKADAKAKVDKEKADKEFTEEMYEQIEAQKILNESLAQWERQEFEDSMKQYDATQKANKEAMMLDEAKKQAQLANLAQVNQALNGFASLIGQQTIAGKALAIATTTIDTYVASFRAYKEGLKLDPTGVFSIIAAAAAAATGIASVRKIMSVQVPGGGGGGGSMPSAATGSVPQFNPAVAQQVQGGGDIQLGMKPQKVYVVESDIRGSMNKVDVIQSNAKIG
jgi:chemotaxis protein histidine kinase CheA